MVKFLKKIRVPPVVSLSQFASTNNKILINRECGGLGDILMHRMMFEDFKRVMPDAHIVWAVPLDYAQAAEDHPFVDEVVNSRTVNPYDFIISYNTTTACGRYEIKMAPAADKHRSDIWANHCGVILTKHNMHLTVNAEAKEWAGKRLHDMGARGRTALLAPVSAQAGKNLTATQMQGVAKYLTDQGYFVFATHTSPIRDLQDIGVPTVWGMNIRQWVAMIDAADCVVSVDTAAFHCAGGLGKPLTGVFTYADGKVYGKYYKFTLVQRHRDDGDWDCGPCFNWPNCPKCPGESPVKPCLTDISVDMLVSGVRKMLS